MLTPITILLLAADPTCADPVWRDADGDGWGDVTAPGCGSEAGWVHNDDDCDDADRGRYPNARETCDGVDEDCDGEVDDHPADASLAFEDADADGYGEWYELNLGATYQCPGTPGWSMRAGDCDDADPAVHRDAPDTCGDAVDPDCVPGCAPLGSLSDASAALPDGPYARLTVGDVDGDGFTDVVGVHRGGTSAWFGPFGVADGPQPVGMNINIGYPYALAIGDLDGDGRDDALLGDPDSIAPESYGARTGRASLFTSDGRSGWRRPLPLYGRFDGDAVGTAVVALPGLALIGAPGDGDHGEVYAQAVDGTGAWVGVMGHWTGATPRFGQGLANAGDFDGDGVEDVVVGGQERATVWLGPFATESRDEADADATIATDRARYLERGPWGVGDTDGDGFDDVLLATPPTSDSPGSLALVGGGVLGERSAEDGLARLDLGSPYSVSAAAGDFDGDGLSDLLIGEPDGAPTYEGSAYVLLGPVSGAISPPDDADRRYAGFEWSGLGSGVTAGDLDGDGRAEMAIGAAAIREGGGLFVFSW